jgi:hypothetical protein
MITTTGPLVWSGMAAGVSVEGPIASVSLRLRSVGGAGFVEATAGSVSSSACVCGVDVSIDAGSVVAAVGAVVFVGAGSGEDAGNVLISTGLVDNASWPLVGRGSGVDTGCAALVEGWSEGEAIAAGQRGTSDCGGQARELRFTELKALQRVNKTRATRSRVVQRGGCARVRV